MKSLFEHVDILIRRNDLPWTRRGDIITVKLSGDRHHQVILTRQDDLYVFRSRVLRANDFPAGLGSRILRTERGDATQSAS
jgi:hypothetical protein